MHCKQITSNWGNPAEENLKYSATRHGQFSVKPPKRIQIGSALILTTAGFFFGVVFFFATLCFRGTSSSLVSDIMTEAQLEGQKNDAKPKPGGRQCASSAKYWQKCGDLIYLSERQDTKVRASAECRVDKMRPLNTETDEKSTYQDAIDSALLGKIA